MKAHTSSFKENIPKFGRELDSKITYELNGETIELGSEQLNSVAPHYEGAILKSVMKQLDIDSNVEIPVGTILTYQIGLKIGNEYEYINYGNYVVKSAEKQEDTRSWQITCYDKMLYAMKDYENSDITFPITVKDYLEAICEKVGLEYEGSQFANSDKIIENELYLDNDGRSLGYTFRSVLDEIAQVSGGTICINDDDKLEVRYVKDVGELVNVTGSSLTLETDEEVELDNFELEGKTEQDGEPTPDYPSELVSVGYENYFTLDYITAAGITKNDTETNDFTYTDCWGRDIVLNTNLIKMLEPSTSYTITYKYQILERPSTFGRWNVNYNLLLYNGSSSVSLGTTNKNTIELNKWETTTAAFTTPSNLTDYRILAYNFKDGDNTTTGAIRIKDLMITKIQQAHSYIPYGKYGIEVKTTGKNFAQCTSNEFTYNGITYTPIYDDNGLLEYINVNGTASDNSSYSINPKLIISKNTDYMISGCPNGGSLSTYRLVCYLYDKNETYLSGVSETGNGVVIKNANVEYVNLLIYVRSGTVCNNLKFYPMLEQGTQVTEYEPYKSNTYLYTLDNPLRSIGDTKDLLYIKNGMLYVDRKIGKVVLDGSESGWVKQSTTTGLYRYNLTHTDLKPGYQNALSNYFTMSEETSFANIASVSFATHPNNQLFCFFTNETALNNWKTWLSTHNTEVQYLLDTPYTEEIGQVDIPSTYKGITYLNTTDELEPNMNVSYISEIETIDEEYLKDVNVNFGEKFGKVNTIVLSRGGDGDKISLSIPSDLADEDKVAIQITDNQIMNGNDRNEYMAAILNKLYGLEYYINDFTSTGICYLDLCDRYRIKIGDNSYKCIMFNNEVDITQGLEELIYTDMQEENQQEYKYMNSTDRGIAQANIIAKKNEGTIQEITQKIIGDNGLEARVGRVETTQTATERTINVISENITYQYDEQGNPISSDINSVKTTTGFTFNADGLTIADSQTNFIALHDNTGTYYKEGNEVIGQYTKDGSKQKDLQLFGVYYYGMSDINDTPMFVAQLYTDENGNEAFGHFYNRGD